MLTKSNVHTSQSVQKPEAIDENLPRAQPWQTEAPACKQRSGQQARGSKRANRAESLESLEKLSYREAKRSSSADGAAAETGPRCARADIARQAVLKALRTRNAPSLIEKTAGKSEKRNWKSGIQLQTADGNEINTHRTGLAGERSRCTAVAAKRARNTREAA